MIWQISVFLSLLNANSIGASNNNSSSHSTEKSMVHNSNSALNFLSHFDSILDGSFKVQIYNVVSVVCDGNFISVDFVVGTGSHAKYWFASLAGWECGYGTKGVFVAEGGDFDWYGETRSKSIGELGFVNCTVEVDRK